MRFSPKLETELSNFVLLENGVYPFRVVEAEDKISKNGNEMIVLKLMLWDKEGSKHFVYDYLLEKVAYKLKHFAEATELTAEYNSGELIALYCLDKEGTVELIIQPGQEKPEGGFYPDKNSVKDYIVGPKKEYVNLDILKTKDDFNDDIPF